jgi:hypothetical protein
MRAPLIALASLFAVAVSGNALAANACVTAADKGQDLRAEGKLDDARAMFAVCSKATCNKVVRADCDRWVKEIDEQLEREKAERAEKAEKEKEKKEEKALAPVVSTVRVPIAIVDPSSSSAATPTSAFPVGPAVLGGLGVLSLAAFGYFQMQGWSRYESLEDGCAKTQSCTDAEIEGTRWQFGASAAALGVSVVSFGVAAVLYFTRSSTTTPASVGVRPGGAAVSF